MACGSCGKRGKLIGAAAKAIITKRPVMPLVRGLGRTITNDARVIARNTAIISRFGRR